MAIFIRLVGLLILKTAVTSSMPFEPCIHVNNPFHIAIGSVLQARLHCPDNMRLKKVTPSPAITVGRKMGKYLLVILIRFAIPK